MNNVIEIKNLTKRYGDLVALDHFNLTVKEGGNFRVVRTQWEWEVNLY